MGEDEVGTLAALTSHISEVFEPEITAHHGWPDAIPNPGMR